MAYVSPGDRSAVIVGEGEVAVHPAAEDPVLEGDEGTDVVAADDTVQRLHPLAPSVRLAAHRYRN